MHRWLTALAVVLTVAVPGGLTHAQDDSGERSFVQVNSAVLDIDPFMRNFASTADGGFVAARPCQQDTAVCVERFGADGQPDTTFGDGGEMVVAEPAFALNGWADLWPSHIDVAADGTITILADCVNWYEGRDQSDMIDICLIRIGADGQPHPSIPGGFVAYALDRYQSAGGVSLNPDGSGWISGYCSSSICIGRITSSGALDPTWDDGSYFPGLTKAKFGEYSMSYGIIPVGDGVWSYGRCATNPLYPDAGRVREGCLVAFGGSGGVDTTTGTNGHINFLPSDVVADGNLRVDNAPSIAPLSTGGYIVVASCTTNVESWAAVTCVTQLDDAGNLVALPSGDLFTVLPVDYRSVDIVDGRVMAIGVCDQEWYDNNRPCLVTYDAAGGPLTTPTVLPLGMDNSWDLMVMANGADEATLLGRCYETQTCLFTVRSSTNAPLSPPEPATTTSVAPGDTVPPATVPPTTEMPASDDTTPPATTEAPATTSPATTPPSTTVAVTPTVPTASDSALGENADAAEVPAAENDSTDSGGGVPVGVVIVIAIVVLGVGVGGGIAVSRRRPS